MTQRSTAVVLTLIGGALLVWKGDGSATQALGLVAALVALAAAWLVAGTARVVLGWIALVMWAGAVVLAVTGTAGWIVTAGTVAGAAGALQIGILGRRWSGWSGKYERTANVAADDPRAMWDRLDRGEDPTSSES